MPLAITPVDPHPVYTELDVRSGSHQLAPPGVRPGNPASGPGRNSEDGCLGATDGLTAPHGNRDRTDLPESRPQGHCWRGPRFARQDLHLPGDRGRDGSVSNDSVRCVHTIFAVVHVSISPIRKGIKRRSKAKPSTNMSDPGPGARQTIGHPPPERCHRHMGRHLGRATVGRCPHRIGVSYELAVVAARTQVTVAHRDFPVV